MCSKAEIVSRTFALCTVCGIRAVRVDVVLRMRGVCAIVVFIVLVTWTVVTFRMLMVLAIVVCRTLVIWVDRVSQAAPMVYIDPRPQKYLCEMYSVVVVAGLIMHY